MFYHISLNTGAAALEQRLGRTFYGPLRGHLPLPRSEAYSRPWWPVISVAEPQRIVWKQWGLVPPNTAKPHEFVRLNATFQAPLPSLFLKAPYKSPANAGQRCLIPVTSFVAWEGTQEEQGSTERRPFAIKPNDGSVFCLAGVFEGETFSILTHPAESGTPSFPIQAELEPVVIHQAYKGDWLNPVLNRHDVLRFCTTANEEGLVAEKAVIDPPLP